MNYGNQNGMGEETISGYQLGVDRADPNYLAMKVAIPRAGEAIRVKEVSYTDNNGAGQTIQAVYYDDYQEACRQNAENVKMRTYSEQNWLKIEEQLQSYLKEKYELDHIRLVYASAAYPYDTLLVTVEHTETPRFFAQMLYSPKENDYREAGIEEKDRLEYKMAAGYVRDAYWEEFSRLGEFILEKGLATPPEEIAYYGGIPGTSIQAVTIGQAEDEGWISQILAYGRQHRSATAQEIRQALTESGFDGSVHTFTLRVYQTDPDTPITREYYAQVYNALSSFLCEAQYDAVFAGNWDLKLSPAYLGNEAVNGYQSSLFDLGYILRPGKNSMKETG